VRPSPRRLIEVLANKNATGFALQVEVPLAQLRRLAEKAARDGRPGSIDLPPFRKPE
jgi:hypothetical protein